MKELHNIYNLHIDDVRYRGKLKTRTTKDFKDQLEFLRTSNKNIPAIVISRATALNEIDFSNDKECMLPQLNWPPTVDEIFEGRWWISTIFLTLYFL